MVGLCFEEVVIRVITREQIGLYDLLLPVNVETFGSMLPTDGTWEQNT